MNSIETLFDLIKQDKISELENILKTSTDLDLNIKDKSGNYLITYVILKNNVKLLKLVLQKECRIDINDQEGRGILYFPIKFGYIDIIKTLVEYDEKSIGISLIDFKDKYNNIPIHYAIFFKNYSAIEVLIRTSNLNTRDENGNTSLHLGIYTTDYDICKIILDHDVDVNAKTYIGETALHIACNFNLFQIIELLVNKGIDVNAQEYNNEITALIYSINLNDNKISMFLLNNGADQNSQDFIGNTALHHAINNDNNYMINELLKRNNTNLNLYNIDGKLPIHMLLDKETTLNQTSGDIIIKVISGSNLNFQDTQGNTPLHLICKYEVWEEYKDVLSKKKLNIFVSNHDGKMPINYVNNIDPFIDMVTQSYLYILRNSNFLFKDDWENKCNKELFYDTLNNSDKKELTQYIDNKNSIKASHKDICYDIVKTKLLSLYKNGNQTCNNASFPLKKNRKCVMLEPINDLEFCTYTGITLDILIGLIYLLNKYDYTCATIGTNFITNKDLCNYYSNIGYKINTKCEFLNFEIVWIYKKLFFSEEFKNNFIRCLNNKKTRFIIIPLGIELQEGSHANYLIFDSKTYEIERFEPYGSTPPHKFDYNAVMLDNVLSNRFSEIDDRIKYIRPSEYLPKISFQYFDIYEPKTKKIGDPGGFCSVWSLWYTEMRIKYYDIDRKSLAKKLLKKMKSSGISFKTFIRSYSNNILLIRDEVFNKSNISINDWLNDQYTEKQYTDVIAEITKLLHKHTGS